jgi:trehalose 6-phosphate phosphatase
MDHIHPTAPPPRIDWTRHAAFLDFDGTLSPLVDQPDQARLAPGVADLLIRLHDVTGGAIAIVTGRAIADIAPKLPQGLLTLSGSHGLELQHPGQPATLTHRAEGLFETAIAALETFAAPRDLRVEAKPGAIALHYRNNPDLGPDCQRCVTEIADAHPGLRAMHGNMVSEVAIAGVDKGIALKTLMEQAPFAGRTPIMAGDDVTDEDGFAAAQALSGFGIRIASPQTSARYGLPSLDAFVDWLSGTLPSR